MAIKTTTWHPDTCNCEISYSWDNTLSEENRVHTFSHVDNKCSAHQSLSDQQIYDTISEENPRKNITLERCLTSGPSALYDTNPDGSRKLKTTLGFNFSWSGTAPNRVLTVSFTGVSLTTTQKNTIQSALNTRFGSGKVLII